jgi:hypothetical protein
MQGGAANHQNSRAPLNWCVSIDTCCTSWTEAGGGWSSPRPLLSAFATALQRCSAVALQHRQQPSARQSPLPSTALLLLGRACRLPSPATCADLPPPIGRYLLPIATAAYTIVVVADKRRVGCLGRYRKGIAAPPSHSVAADLSKVVKTQRASLSQACV